MNKSERYGEFAFLFREDTVIVRKGENRQYLRVVGIKEHTNRFLEIMEILPDLEEFRNRSHPRRIFLHEGFAVPMSPEEEISPSRFLEKYGEIKSMVFFAKYSGIETLSSEPQPPYCEAKEVVERFSPEDITLYYFMRLIPQISRTKQDEKIKEEFLSSRLADIKKALCNDTSSQFEEVDFSYKYLVQLYETRYSQKFSFNDGDFFRNQTYIDYMPQESRADESVVRQISRAVNKIRDREYIGLIKKLWDEGYSIFSIKGKIHVENVREQLEQLGEPIKN